MQATKLLVLILACSVAVGSATANNCCPSFSASQEKFLRGLLQEEAKGLKAGMMRAFSMQPTVRWFNLSNKLVCFGATGNSFGRFNVKAEGFVAAIKLVYYNGSLTCDRNTLAKKPDEFNSKWGCAPSHPFFGKTSINTLVTTSTNKIIFPKDHHFTHDHSDLWYNMEQFDSMSDVLVFQRFHDPLYVATGQELRLWYGEDLKDVSEKDNYGKTCARVLALYV